MFEKLYDWILKKAESRHASSVLMVISFIESSFFPFPPDPLLAIVVAKNQKRYMYYALLCSGASVLGGFLGYYIGYECFDLIGSTILKWLDQTDNFQRIVQSETFNKYAFLLICAKGLTPIPYKIVTIASGFTKVDLLTFTTASIITRGMRFIALSLICRRYGNFMLGFIEQHKKTVFFLMLAIIVIGFLLIKIF
ncbi:MAG: DedA family protein [Holosporaceae bacterium]|jgi:membrane protein YqaA with SNARE-associated domain|nr:DedA family protein [Holosporaceae bacterium]